LACFVLHNIARQRKQPMPEDDGAEENELLEFIMPPEEPVMTPTDIILRACGFVKRKNITENHF